MDRSICLILGTVLLVVAILAGAPVFSAKDDSDAAIDPAPADVTCRDLSHCVGIDKGCCLGEKRVVVNRDRAKLLSFRRALACKELIESKLKEGIDMCKDRRVRAGHRSEKIECKKDKEKPIPPKAPDLKEMKNDRQAYQEHYKQYQKEYVKYQELLIDYEDTLGTCSLVK